MRSTLNPHTYSIGRSHRFDFTRLPTRTHSPGENPPPTAYDARSSFDQRNMRWKSLADRRLIVDEQRWRSEFPGPADYQSVATDFGKHAQKYTIRGKYFPWKTEDFPGPGSYSPGGELHKLGVYRISKHLSSKAPKISKPTPKTEILKTETDSPGPGAYETKPNLSKTGVYFLQGYSNSRCRTFSKASRRLISKSISSISHVDTPGPGAYSFQSEFSQADMVVKQGKVA